MLGDGSILPQKKNFVLPAVVVGCLTNENISDFLLLLPKRVFLKKNFLNCYYFKGEMVFFCLPIHNFAGSNLLFLKMGPAW